MNIAKKGQRVYLPELDAFAIVEEVREDGRITKVKIGDRIINAIDFIVENYSVIKFLFLSLLKLFR